ncbi:uncharacterized protein BYT42DRAFT_152121 [Radiomyces spectabilis]|uniref:uncharacterized protein n=1 Tax=Radiomyces spectabilis TaxID=64574 RepID=UPI00221FFD55|nr:uncharacterized protein BYT42DRAFT_152121 [Radiomyces spectabilis]KAI8366052.1 hypothetical protein BYT42DRAFT_152121 [Radiomyces spectabilis]
MWVQWDSCGILTFGILNIASGLGTSHYPDLNGRADLAWALLGVLVYNGNPLIVFSAFFFPSSVLSLFDYFIFQFIMSSIYTSRFTERFDIDSSQLLPPLPLSPTKSCVSSPGNSPVSSPRHYDFNSIRSDSYDSFSKPPSLIQGSGNHSVTSLEASAVAREDSMSSSSSDQESSSQRLAGKLKRFLHTISNKKQHKSYYH